MFYFIFMLLHLSKSQSFNIYAALIILQEQLEQVILN